jgi:hypothetical protein
MHVRGGNPMRLAGVALLLLVACGKSAQEQVAEHQLMQIKAEQERQKKDLERFSGKEDEVEKRMSFECAQQLRNQRKTSLPLSPKCRAEQEAAEKSQ